MKFVDDIETNSINRASSGWLKDWYGSGRNQKGNDASQVPTEKNLDLLYEMYSKDATVFATVNTFVNKATSNGWRIESKNKQELKRANKLLKDLSFDILLPNLLKNMVVYGDAFVEIEYKTGTQIPFALHVLETTQMRIVSDEHGDVSGYEQVKGGKDPVKFTLDEVVHFKWLEFGGRLFGASQLSSLMSTVATKKFAETFNTTTFKNYSPRMAWIVKNGSEEQVKSFVDMLKLAKDQPHKDIVVNGEVEFKPLVSTSDDTNFLELQRFLREQIMMTTQVPPIMLGLPDNANRSSAEAMMRAFESNVKAIQRPTSHTTTEQLFKLLGIGSTEFFFNPLDKRNEKDDLEIATKLADIGFDDTTIVEFLKRAGVDLRDGAKIKKSEPIPTMIAKEDGDISSKDMTEPKTGSEGTTREDQLRRSWESQLLKNKQELWY